MKRIHYILVTISLLLMLLAAGAYKGEIYLLDECNHTSRDSVPHAYKIYPDTPMDTVLAWIERDYETTWDWAWQQHRKYLHMDSIVPGYYKFDTVIGDRTLIRRLTTGEQSQYKLVLTQNMRTCEHIAKRLGETLLLDSMEIITRLQDPTYIGRYGLKEETATCLFIPNTYFIYWTITPDELFERMGTEYKRFWNDERQAKAAKLGLSIEEVMTLASIVNSETFRAKEWSKIASLYLNRLRKGMLLQADPTVIFANRNFAIRRVLRRHIAIDSPYNTYKTRGLPPGPIRCAQPACIDSVLNAPETNYIYMCANPDFSGTHVFTSRYSDHLRIAAQYQHELNRRNIRK